MVLEQELETFRRELPLLLQNAENREKFALFFRNKVEGVFPTREEALAAGYHLFDVKPFLVKLITEHEKPKYFSRNVAQCP